jgi:serine/threonine protein phosphatase 1
MRKIAISDIHGCIRTFRYLLEEKIRLQPEDHLFLLGDFIDRGPNSKGVIDYILELQQSGYQLTCLLGNHEEMLLRSFTESLMRDVWESNGGMETMMSFGVRTAEEIPDLYMDFFRELKLYHEEDNYIMVHAGLNLRDPNPFEDRETILWSRKWNQFMNYHWLDGRCILYGHTPHEKSDIKEQWKRLSDNQYLCIDGGCVFDYRPDLGTLVGYDMTHSKLYFTSNRD